MNATHLSSVATFQPLISPFDSTNSEDPMELYPDLENRPTADDGLDIDLDLTIDPPENLDDDKMIEDPEVMMEEEEEVEEEDAIHPDIEIGHDEQMIDDTAEDVDVLHESSEDSDAKDDEDLDDVGFADPGDDLEENVDVTKHFIPPNQSNLGTISQDNAQQAPLDHIQPRTPAHSDKEIGSRIFSQGPEELFDQGEIDEVYGDTLPNRRQTETAVYEARSPLVQDASRSKNSQDSAEEPQVIELEDQPAQNHIIDISAKSSTAFGESSDDPGNVETKAGDISPGIPRHGMISPQSDAGLQRDTAEARHGNADTPLSHALDQDNSDMSAADVHSRHHQEYSGALATSADQNVDTAQGDRYVHPVMVLYEDSEMFLFPPAAEEQDDNQTYFLTNEALAMESIHTLLRECRNVLEENLSAQEELEIEIDTLGLKIRESSVDATSVTLVHILDIYLQLCYHDGIETPPPMRMIFTTNVRFSHRLDQLAGFVADGKGLSQIEEDNSSVHIESPEHAEEPERWSDEQLATADHTVIPDEGSADGILDEAPRILENSAAQISTEDIHNSPDLLINNTKGQSTSSSVQVERTVSADGISSASVMQPLNEEATSNAQFDSTVPFDEQYSDKSAAQLAQEVGDVEQKTVNNEEEQDDTHEVDDDPNEDSSVASSTVQGDDILTEKEQVSILNREDVYGHEAVLAEQLPTPKPDEGPEAGDFITYESDEEGDLANASQDDEAVNFKSTGAVPLTSVGSSNTTNGPISQMESNDAADNDSLGKPTLDVFPPNPKESIVHCEHTDRNEGGGREEEVVQNGAWNPKEYQDNDQDGTLDSVRSSKIERVKGHGSNTIGSWNLSNADLEGSKHPAQRSVQSADDEDEITFDDEIEAETVTSEQATGPSPDSLKRARACDDNADLHDTKDTKRVRSR